MTEERKPLRSQAVAEPERKPVIFWARAAKYRIANFKPEQRYHSGQLQQREVSIRFDEHLKVTADPEEIEFIRQAAEFNINVFECPTIEDATRRTREQKQVRQVREFTDEVNESVRIT